MADMRIKVTGYLYPDDLPFDQVDLSHEMGLSPQGYEAMTRALSLLDDPTFELEADE